MRGREAGFRREASRVAGTGLVQACVPMCTTVIDGVPKLDIIHANYLGTATDMDTGGGDGLH